MTLKRLSTAGIPFGSGIACQGRTENTDVTEVEKDGTNKSGDRLNLIGNYTASQNFHIFVQCMLDSDFIKEVEETAIHLKHLNPWISAVVKILTKLDSGRGIQTNGYDPMLIPS